MTYLSTTETGKRWNISARRVAKLASEGKIKGAAMVGNSWMIPETASKPEDGRKRSAAGEDRYVFPDLIYGISSDDDPEDLPTDEKQLYNGVRLFLKTEYTECIRILEKLLRSTDRQCLRIGAYYYLENAYVIERKFDKAAEMINLFDKAIASADCNRDELLLMKQQQDCYLYGSAEISKPFAIDIESRHSKGFLPFLAEENTYSDLCSFYTDTPRNNVACHEIMCMMLENQGYFYAAFHMHFYIAVIYSFGQNEKKRDSHLKKSLDLALKHECYSAIAFYLWIFPDCIPVLQKYYPRETVDLLLNASKQRKEASRAFIKYISIAEIFQILTDEDHLLISRVMGGYSIQQMAELGKVSISTVKQKLGKLYKKAGVKNKKELVEKYTRELLDLQATGPINTMAQTVQHEI